VRDETDFKLNRGRKKLGSITIAKVRGRATFQSTAQALQQSLGTAPLLSWPHWCLILGILYESHIHPLTICRRCLPPASARSRS